MQLSVPAQSSPSAADRLIPLSRLTPSQNAVIVEVCNSCPELCHRLAMMGLAPGACVQMVLAGRTCLIKAGRSRFSLRSADLDSIMVERVA